MIRIGCVLVMASLLVPAAAAAGPIWSLPQPEGWTDVSAEMQKDPLFVRHRTEADGLGRNIALVAYSAPSGESLAAWAYTVPQAEISMDQLDAWILSSRDQHRRMGTEISYRRRRDPKMIEVRQNIDLGEQVVYVRLLAGFDRNRQMQSVIAMCKPSSITCAPLLLSLTLDKAQLAPLPAETEGKRSEAHNKRGGAAGGILLLVLIALLWIRSSHRKRAARTPIPPVA